MSESNSTSSRSLRVQLTSQTESNSLERFGAGLSMSETAETAATYIYRLCKGRVILHVDIRGQLIAQPHIKVQNPLQWARSLIGVFV